MSEQSVPYVTSGAAPNPIIAIHALAIARYLLGDISEGQLARKLNLDRLEARTRVAEFLNMAVNANVPIQRIDTLETRLATTLSQLDRLTLENTDLRRDLAAERAHVIELAHVARYARELTQGITLQIGNPEENDSLSAAELYALATAALGEKGEP
jgi:hypothetical protein